MKAILVAAFTLLAVSANAATTLSDIECVSTNGVRIETLEKRPRTLLVETKIGFFKKNFVAKIHSLSGATEESFIELNDIDSGDDYGLSLSLHPGDFEKQVSYGTLVRQGDGLVVPFVIAAVRCEVTLEHRTR